MVVERGSSWSYRPQKKCFKDMLQDPSEANKELYNDAKKAAKKEVAKAKSEESETFMLDLESDKTSRKVYRVAKQMKREKTDVIGVGCIRDNAGKLCFDEKERGEVWKC